MAIDSSLYKYINLRFMRISHICQKSDGVNMRISCLDVSLFFIPGLLEMSSPTRHFSLRSDCILIGITDILVLLCVPPEQKGILYFAP